MKSHFLVQFTLRDWMRVLLLALPPFESKLILSAPDSFLFYRLMMQLQTEFHSFAEFQSREGKERKEKREKQQNTHTYTTSMAKINRGMCAMRFGSEKKHLHHHSIGPTTTTSTNTTTWSYYISLDQAEWSNQSSVLCTVSPDLAWPDKRPGKAGVYKQQQLLLFLPSIAPIYPE